MVMPSGINPWSEFLEQAPSAAYYSSPAGQAFASGSPKQRSYFEYLFSNKWQGTE